MFFFYDIINSNNMDTCFSVAFENEGKKLMNMYFSLKYFNLFNFYLMAMTY